MSRIKVLHIGSPTGMFGAERWILALCRHLPESDVESVVGVVQDNGQSIPPLAVHAQSLGFRSLVVNAPGKLSLSAIGQLKQFIATERIDILHTHGYKSDILGSFAVSGTGCRLVTTPHGWSVDAGLKLRIYEALDRLAFAAFDAVVPLSDDLYAGLQRLPWVRRRLHFIRNGVDLSEVEAAATVAPGVAAAKAKGDRIYGYIGQLIPRKRIDTLIRAFANLRHQNKRLFIIGDGPARGELESLAAQLGQSPRVHFEGFREDRLNYLRGMDVFVLPSALEGIPRCVMEAMAAGIPSVITDIEGCRALVQDGETGLLFPVGDEQVLTRLLMQLEEDESMAGRLGEAGRQHVREVFSADTMAGKYLKLYRQLLRHRDTESVSPSPSQTA